MKTTETTASKKSGYCPEQTCGPVSRLAIGLLVLPASWVISSGFRNWLGRLSFPEKLLADPGQVIDRVADASRVKQLAVCLPLNAALAIHSRQGILPVLKACWRIGKSESLAGIWWRLFRRVPVRIPVCDATSPDFHKNNRYKRILVMDYRIPKYDVSAGNRATWGILQDLAAIGYDVTFMPSTMYHDTFYAQQLSEKGIEVITNDSGYSSPAHFLAKNGATFSFFYLVRLDVAEEVLTLIRKFAPKGRILFHAPDVHFMRERREADLFHDASASMQAMNTKKRELALMNSVDHVVAISKDDAASLHENGMTTRITIFQGLYAPVKEYIPDFSVRNDIFFLGGFAHKPNLDAVMWFTHSVWPLIHSVLPEVQFHIVGSEASEEVLRLGKIPGVVVDGFVRNLDSFMDTMRVNVAPLRFGAGIKGKIAMTMGAGVPCVCTTIAAEGMHIMDGIQALIADDEDSFAQSVIMLYNDALLWNVLSENGLALVNRFFGEESNRRSLLTVFNEAQALPVRIYCAYCSGLSVPKVFLAEEKIDVSIIIPVYNQWKMTEACLKSVHEEYCRTDLHVEIILADDGSTDETIHAEVHFPGIRHIKTQQNRGFLRNCNESAQQARGKYILFLNNDTIVMPGWLSSLYNTAKDDPSIAIVGSKMLFPDEKVQEAGGVLFENASGMNVGRGMSRFLAPLNEEREVDYLSGCSILVQKAFWDAAEGFDERYATAYFEDADLAMTAHAYYLRVVYQPVSEVVHFEGTSYNDSKKDALMKINKHLFHEKWSYTLKDYLSDSTPWNVAMYHAEALFSRKEYAKMAQGTHEIETKNKKDALQEKGV